MEYLFAYGLLRGEFESPVANLMKRYAKRLGPATLHAQIYDIGGYPGVIAPYTDNHIVQGELFEITDPNKLWHQLDAFEGISAAHQAPYEYERRLSAVTREDGSQIEAWVYWYNWPVDNKPRICSGDYLQRIAAVGSYGRPG